MTRIFDAAEEVQSRLQQWGWKFCFIGALAVQRWGEPRFTQDVDLTLLTGFGDEEKFIERLLGSFPARRADAQAMALSSRVLLLKTSNAVPVDIALGAVPFEVRSIERSLPWKEERDLVTCCAEDLVVHKAFAGRDRDWADLEGIVVRQHKKLDLALIRREIEPLLELKDAQETWPRLERLIAKADRKLAK